MKLKLGKRQTIIFVLIGIGSSLFYYAGNLIRTGETFSDGILVGFLLGLTFICSLSAVLLWLQMLYLNLKVRQCKK